MADNISVKDSALADKVVATKDIGGVHHQKYIPHDTAGVAMEGRYGSLTETAPANDTASSGLNGRLQRIAQRLSSLIGLLPTALGSNGGLKVEAAGAAATPVLIPALTNTAQTVIGSAKTLDSYYLHNPNTSKAYVQIFDSASVTVGTTVPKWSLGIPPESAANLANVNLGFANSIKVAATTTPGGSTAPAIALDCNFGYL